MRLRRNRERSRLLLSSPQPCSLELRRCLRADIAANSRHSPADISFVPRRPLSPVKTGIATVTTVGLERPGPVGIHAAATEPCHCAAASALKIRSVDL